MCKCIGAMSTSQRVVIPCRWRVKASMVCVWVAGKIVWSPCYKQAIPEHFRGDSRQSAIQIHIYFTLLTIDKVTKKLHTAQQLWMLEDCFHSPYDWYLVKLKQCKNYNLLHNRLCILLTNIKSTSKTYRKWLHDS